MVFPVKTIKTIVFGIPGSCFFWTWPSRVVSKISEKSKEGLRSIEVEKLCPSHGLRLRLELQLFFQIVSWIRLRNQCFFV